MQPLGQQMPLHSRGIIQMPLHSRGIIQMPLNFRGIIQSSFLIKCYKFHLLPSYYAIPSTFNFQIIDESESVAR
uniref:Uncharacterized protein n=1 Tax=Onchocerca volvulus TaxID=6282 RepID=A0A8R1U0Z1_ONCVO